MQVLRKDDLLTERRKDSISHDDLWENLSLAQKFSASSLTQFGYQLICIRSTNAGNIAILNCDQKTSIISEDGIINTSLRLNLRH